MCVKCACVLFQINEISVIVQVVQDGNLRALCGNQRGPVSRCRMDWKGLWCPLRAAIRTDLGVVKLCIGLPYRRHCRDRVASRMLFLHCSGCPLLKKVL